MVLFYCSSVINSREIISELSSKRATLHLFVPSKFQLHKVSTVEPLLQYSVRSDIVRINWADRRGIHLSLEEECSHHHTLDCLLHHYWILSLKQNKFKFKSCVLVCCLLQPSPFALVIIFYVFAMHYSIVTYIVEKN